jgi:hypothetical protein
MNGNVEGILARREDELELELQKLGSQEFGPALDF